MRLPWYPKPVQEKYVCSNQQGGAYGNHTQAFEKTEEIIGSWLAQGDAMR